MKKFVFALLVVSVGPRLLALDDHNPIGVTGAFEGVTTTASAYNVLSHSATRQIDDIVVPGAIGKYGLKMTRYYSSRRGFGDGWRHGYAWTSSNGKVRYPNGNMWDNSCTGDWGLAGPLGVSDSPTTWNGSPAFRLADGGTVVFGDLEWTTIATKIIDPYGQETNITLGQGGLITRVTEPGGRYLEFIYSTVNGWLMLTRVDAYDGPQGHRIDYVIYNYTGIKPAGGGNSGQPVNCLTRVDYSDGTQAFYTYQDDNVPDQPYPPCPCSVKAYPLLRTCRDVRHEGRMRHICYEYQTNGPHGAIIAERYSLNGSTNGPRVSKIDPPAPSPIVIDPFFETTYIETRGDGTNVTRSFTYTSLHISRVDGENVCPTWIPRENNPAPEQFLTSYTDFEGNTTYLDYDQSTWYVNSVRDARGNTTAYARASPPPQGIGQITDVTYPNNTGTVHYDYQPEPGAIPGHYLTGITINRGVSPAAKTIHTRDSNHRITLTDYMEGNTVLARETFTYCDQPDPQQCSNNPLGQIKTQKLKNGGYAHYKYDVRGLLLAKTEPTWIVDGPTALSTAPKTTYTYYSTEVSYNVTINGVSVIIYPWTDRLKTVTLPANESGLQASDTYEYDRVLDSYPSGITNLTGQARPGRGLVTKIIHADTPSDTYQQFKYDAYGNKRWEDNELRNITTYVYDEYNRVLSVNRPLSQITTYTYNPTNGSSYTHTSNNPDTVTVRTSATTNIVTTNVYDKNFRKTSSAAAGSTTWFHYDPVGNQDYVTDARGSGSRDSRYTTYTDYDERNRRWQTREPLGRTTWFEYGDNINITKIHRPDGTAEDKTYDGMSRLRFNTVPKTGSESITTELQYNPWNGDSTDSGHSGGLLRKVIDGNLKAYEFKYDGSGLKTRMIYPDSSVEVWAYDDAHNLESRTTVAGEIQNFAYDTRNRKIREWWDGWPADGEWRAFDYDDTGHLTLATNGTGTYWTNFIADVRRSYDAAGRLTQDQQTVYVNGVQNTKNVNYPSYDDDGKLLRMYVGGVGYDYTFSYDSMGRFEKIFITGNNNIQFEYSYDPASNETQRFNWVNRVAQIYVPDELNRTTSVELRNTNVPNTQLGIESYEYYPIGRLHTVTREDNKEDQFTYYLDGELKQVTYGVTATPPPTPPPGATPAPPIARAATNVTSTGFTANWSSVSGAVGYRLDVSRSNTFANYVSGYQDLNVGNFTSRAVSGLAANTTYYYRVRAYNTNGTSGNSNVINVMTAVANQVAEPRFNPDGGSTNQHSLQVTISTATTGAQMRYTINDPTPPSPTYGTLIPGTSATITLSLGHATLQAIAFRNGMTDSPIHTADFDYENGRGPSVYPLDNAGPPPAGPVAPDLGGTFTYTLDNAGNRTAVNNINYSPNSINQYTSVGGIPVTNATDHQIQVYGGFTYTYMRDQELKRITATGLTFDVAYDALGRCVKRTVNGDPTYYIYDGAKPILEYRSDGTVARNLYGKGTDEILQRIDPAVNGGGAFYFQQDHEGSVTHLTNRNNGNGQIIERYRYDVFGTPIIYTPPPNWTQRQTSLYSNRWLFTGREYFGAWVYDYRARVYHTYLGRFMSEDPKLFDAGDYNLFRYCHNDPIDFTDPMGLDNAGPAPTSSTERLWNWQKHFDRSSGAMAAGLLAFKAEQQMKAFGRAAKDAVGKYIRWTDSNRAAMPRWLQAFHQFIDDTGGVGLGVPVGSVKTVGEFTKVFRVWGDGSRPWGPSWTPVDPRTIPNYRNVAGLPNQNSGRFLSEGILRNTEGVTAREAMPLHGGDGGLRELEIRHAEQQVQLQNVQGVNPPF